jgi:hypothetical protein
MAEKLPSAESADDILGVEDTNLLEVEVPEWKRTIHLRSLPADEGTELGERVEALGPKGQNARLMLLAAAIVDAKGQRIFTTPEQIEQLGKRSLKVLMRLEKAAMRLNYDEAAAKNA